MFDRESKGLSGDDGLWMTIFHLVIVIILQDFAVLLQKQSNTLNPHSKEQLQLIIQMPLNSIMTDQHCL